MERLFISDLHLSDAAPEITTCFERFLELHTQNIDELYILGDFFEVWIGDDNVTEFNTRIAHLFKQLSQTVPIYFIHGNRDFAIGNQFAKKAGFTILPEQTVIDLYGTPTLLLHGDELCTQDEEYQKFRKRARTRWWQFMMGSLPLRFRRYLANRGRKRSTQNKMRLAADIMDVTQSAVESTLIQHNVDVMIHGHTHRPNVHEFTVAGKQATRIVLGDWYEQGSMLVATPDKITLETLSFKS